MCEKKRREKGKEKDRKEQEMTVVLSAGGFSVVSRV